MDSYQIENQTAKDPFLRKNMRRVTQQIELPETAGLQLS